MKCPTCQGKKTITQKCTNCGGSGDATCGMCNGTGKGMYGEPCRGPCGGTGKIPRSCSSCGGTGKVDVSCPTCQGTGDGLPDKTTVWECTCAKCGFSWTDSDDNTTCPECGSDEGMCAKTEIPSNPIMPND